MTYDEHKKALAHAQSAVAVPGRIFQAGVDGDEACAVCGETLHPYPEPEYWMQHPLPICSQIDGMKVCSEDYPHWKDCLPKYLAGCPSEPQQMELFA